MKIALIAERIGRPDLGTGPYPGDPAARVLSLAAALAGLDHQVTVCARRTSATAHGATDIPGVRIDLVPAGPPDDLTADKLLAHVGAFADQLTRRWQQDPPEVVHAHGWIAGLAALAGARGLRIPVVQAFSSLAVSGQPRHDKQARPQASGPTDQARCEAAIGRTATAVLAATSEDRSALVRRGIPRTAITIVPAGVDAAKFGLAGPVASRTSRPRLLMIAPPSERSVAAVALHALARVPAAELVLAAGPIPANPMPVNPVPVKPVPVKPVRVKPASVPGYKDLTRLARLLGLQDRLTLIGQVSQDEAPALMRSADIFLSPIGSEPFTMVPVEAMACGVPVIAVATGAQRDAVIPGTTGFLVPAAEPELLAHRIRQLLTVPMLAEGYGIAAATRARTRYSWDRIARETLAIYQALPRAATPANAA